MLLHIPAVLDHAELTTARGFLADAPFVDGKLSAGLAARPVKNNLELDRNAQGLESLNNLVMGNLVRHPVYRGGALPLRVATPFYARYIPGMTYGEHIDDPIMGADGMPYRTDIAITIFLNDPAAYDGGELVVRTAFGEQTVKLPAGDAVMYPATSLHRVAPVTRGERLVAVTWVQSLVRDASRRELLYALHLAREALLAKAPAAEETTRVNFAYVNLIRMWGDV